jgi:hypothetical protein
MGQLLLITYYRGVKAPNAGLGCTACWDHCYLAFDIMKNSEVHGGTLCNEQANISLVIHVDITHCTFHHHRIQCAETESLISSLAPHGPMHQEQLRTNEVRLWAGNWFPLPRSSLSHSVVNGSPTAGGVVVVCNIARGRNVGA